MASNKYLVYGENQLLDISAALKGTSVPIEAMIEVTKATALMAIAEELNRMNSKE